MSATLITHRGAMRMPKAELMKIEPLAATNTWKPVAHGVLVNTLTEVLSSRGIEVRKEEYAVQRDGNILFAVMDLFWGGTMDYWAALGLRTSNDKSFAIQIAIGARVVVCDNLMLSGELLALKRKHTAGLELVEELTASVRRYIPQHPSVAAVRWKEETFHEIAYPLTGEPSAPFHTEIRPTTE